MTRRDHPPPEEVFSAESIRELFRTVFEQTSDGILLTTGDHHQIVAANPEACRLLAREWATLRAGTLSDLLAPGETLTLPSAGADVGVGRRRAPLQLLRGDRSTVRLDVAVSANVGPDQHLWFLRENVETPAGSLSEETLELLIERSPFAVQIFDLDGTLIYVNGAWEKMWGARAEDVVGRFNCLRDPQIEALGLKPLLEAIFRGEKTDLRETEFDPSRSGLPGKKRWSRTHTYYLRDDLGALRHVVVLNEDVTEQKEAVAARMRAEEQLLRAQKMTAVGRLAGGIAHDFNNLLTYILSAVELVLRSDPSDPDARGDLVQIRDAASRAADLTRQLLTFARRQPARAVPTNLSGLIRESERMLASLAGSSVTLDLRLANDLRSVLLDPSQGIQVLLNLVANARDAMPRGGNVRLVTENKRSEGEDGSPLPRGDYVVLAVEDEGVGMEADVVRHAFEPFFTTKPPGKGTGLGLATVYGIATQNGGVVEIDSAPRKGARVRITLPAMRDAERVDPGTERPTDPLDGSAATILLVEDEPLVRSTVRKMLEEGRYRVIDFAHARAALAGSTDLEEAPELLVTDVVMPSMSGRELFIALREHYPQLKVLYMSGYTDVALDNDSGLLLQKPFSKESLLDRVGRILEP